MKTNNFIRIGAISLALLSNISNAMPDTKLSLPKAFYEALNADQSLNGIKIYGDHDPANKTIYVSPAGKVIKSGNFNHAGFHDCRSLEQQYKLTYYLPGGDIEDPDKRAKHIFEIVKDKNEPVSPFLFTIMAGAVRNADTNNKIREYAEKAQDLKEGKLKDEYAKYTAKEDEYTERLNREAKAKASLDALDTPIERLHAQIIVADDPEQIKVLKEELKRAYENKKTYYKPLMKEYLKAQTKTDEARKQYLAAKQKIGRTLVDLKELKELITFYHEIYDHTKKEYVDTFNNSVKILKEREQKTVGTVNFTLEVWNNEVNRVAALIKEHAPQYEGYSVVQLPVHGININRTRYRV